MSIGGGSSAVSSLRAGWLEGGIGWKEGESI